jgi:hypothetical protein
MLACYCIQSCRLFSISGANLQAQIQPSVFKQYLFFSEINATTYALFKAKKIRFEAILSFKELALLRFN